MKRLANCDRRPGRDNDSTLRQRSIGNWTTRNDEATINVKAQPCINDASGVGRFAPWQCNGVENRDWTKGVNRELYIHLRAVRAARQICHS